MKLVEKLFDKEGNYETYTEDIVVDGQKVGRADVIVNTEDEDMNYVEWIYIEDEFKNKGYGTQAFKMLAEKYGYIYFAPCDERNKSMYERFAEEITTNTPEVDQGFGVYFMKK